MDFRGCTATATLLARARVLHERDLQASFDEGGSGGMATVAKSQRAGQRLHIRMYEPPSRVMIAAPMPGLEPRDIEVTVEPERVLMRGRERGPHQHDMKLLVAEWTIGDYVREVSLP